MRKKVLTMLLACGITISALAGSTSVFAATETGTADTYGCQLQGVVTDAGQVVSKMVIDFGASKKVTNVDKDTFSVHAVASTETVRQGTDITSYGDYDMDRTIVKAETDGQKVILYFDESEGAVLAYLSAARNYPAQLTYTITQNKPITLTAADGTVLNAEYTASYTCDNIVADPETSKFQSVIVENGINYQFYNAGENVDRLIVWFHGNGEGDVLNSKNNVAQMLGNRGTVAWASDNFQAIFEGAHVMAFQAPDTWYYAQRDNLLDQAAAEIRAVAEQYHVNPKKIMVAGCSAGGYMTTRMIIAHPELFAAAVINCPAYNVATDRGGETPTDEELTAVKNSGVPIWLVQGATDSVVATEECSRRLFNILSAGQTVTEAPHKQEMPQNSDFVTYETPDQKYKLTLYETTEEGKLRFAEDYDQDGVATEVQYSNHWSWIYTLKNNPKAADGTYIINWAASFIK